MVHDNKEYMFLTSQSDQRCTQRPILLQVKRPMGEITQKPG